MQALTAFLLLTSAALAADVTNCRVAYIDTAWDRGNSEITIYTERAIAPDKEPLLPGNTATFANYTSHPLGITCIIIDGLDGLTAADVTTKLGNDNTPSGWAAGPTPSVVALNGKHYLQFAPKVIRGQWVQITIAANATTGLSAAYVCYFGNAPGDTGNSTLNAQVTASDVALAGLNGHTQTDPAPIDDRYDFNRDAIVDAEDSAIATDNPTNFSTALKLIAVP